ncbi:hypothetical protein HPULCUR_007635 [Helicostylum pulchrum]|uniref:Uncharacterized protein n=1 Tax=Helicostylum pulchrum TaxID=562976 RepID=A0ABP9Y5B6_9FUNG
MTVIVLSTGEFVSSGEDRTVRVWKDGQCIQTLQQPCISVWSVAGLPNGDIVVGGSDSVVRVFTREAERMAVPEAQKEFDDLLANQAIPANQLGDINKEKLSGPEALQQPGKKEGQVVMINMGATVEAHQWSGNEWQKIGEVVGSNKSKQTYEGKEYDYVFDIDVGAGPNGNIKLPYNVSQNPYDAAQEFLAKNELPQSFMDQVADFIIKNADGVNLGSGYQDPYTGGNRYTPGATDAAPASNTYADPFTGSGSYRPGNVAPTVPAPSTYNDPFTGGASYRPGNAAAPAAAPASPQSTKILPIRGYLTLKQANPDAVFNKIRSLNEEIADVKLTAEEFEYLSLSISFLKNPTGASLNNDAGILAVIKMVTQWPLDKRFPALDLVRLFALYAPDELAAAIPHRDVAGFLRDAGGLSSDSNIASNETNAMLAYRGLANLFNKEAGRQLAWERRSIISDMLQVDVSGKFKGKTIRLAQSTLAVK